VGDLFYGDIEENDCLTQSEYYAFRGEEPPKAKTRPWGEIDPHSVPRPSSENFNASDAPSRTLTSRSIRYLNRSSCVGYGDRRGETRIRNPSTNSVPKSYERLDFLDFCACRRRP
jgi:hypothetical protein